MPRISGIDIPGKKKIKVSLTSLYGIGKNNVLELLAEANIDPETRTDDLSSEELSRISKVIDELQLNVEGKLRRFIRDNIETLKRIGSYRGHRHQVGLPVRGQRTRVNARTRKGNKRKTVGAMTKEMLAKLETAKKTK